LLEDAGGRFSIAQVSSGEFDTRFQKSTSHYSSRGLSSSVYWLKFTVLNHSQQEDWLLKLGTPLMDHLTLYHQKKGRWFAREAGRSLPFSQQPVAYRIPLFPVALPKGEAVRFYMRFETESTMKFSLEILTEKRFIEGERSESYVFGFYYGIIIAMVLYNLFLWFALKQAAYGYYVFFISSLMILQTVLDGLAYQYFWSNSLWWNRLAQPFFIGMSILGLTGVIRSLLQLKRFYPTLNRLMFVFSLIGGGVAVSVFFLSYGILLRVGILFAFLSIVLGLLSGILCLRQGYRPARYFLLAFSVFFLGALANIVTGLGVYPNDFLAQHGMRIGSVVLVLLFAFTLADHIYLIRLEKEKAERALLKASYSKTNRQQGSVGNLQEVHLFRQKLLANTSHELYTSLNTILGFGELISYNFESYLPERQCKKLQSVVKSGYKLAMLVHDLLNFSKMQQQKVCLERVSVDVYAAVEEVVLLLRGNHIEKSVKIFNKIEKQAPRIQADPEYVHRIFVNLLSNAIKFTEEGYICIAAQVRGAVLEITVKDTGIGIQPEKLTSIFEAFKQGDNSISRKYGGTGLGLAITKNMIEFHGGKMSVTSKLGEGSTFVLTLPVARDSEERISLPLENPEFFKKAPDMPRSSLTEEERHKFLSKKLSHIRQAKILIVDDDFNNLQVASGFLERVGAHVYTASSGKKALEEFRKTSFDLVLLDIMMSEMDGYEVAQFIRKNLKLSVPIIMLTAKAGEDSLFENFRVGVTAFMRKPIRDFIEFYAHIESHLMLSKLAQDQKKLLEKLTDKNQELVEYDLLKTQFLSNASHELKSPINPILSGVRHLLAETNVDIPERHREALLLIDSAAEKLLKLINVVLDFSKIRKGQFITERKELALGTIFNHVLKVTKSLLPNGVAFVDKIKHHELIIFGDQMRLEQVLINLISNACKFTQKGTITLASEQKDGKVFISVEDTGIGIARKEHERIFQPFVQAISKGKHYYPGIGLGLTISEEIIKRHQGAITLRSQENIGSCFTFDLPVKEAEDKQS